MPLTGAHHETIMVIDDEPLVLDMVANVLKSEGYNVVAAQNGEEALNIGTDAGKIDLVLTDIVMPGMSGGELIQKIMARQPGIQVLYMSGYTKYTVLNHGSLESVSSFIWKPFSPADLLAKIRNILDGPPGNQLPPAKCMV